MNDIVHIDMKMEMDRYLTFADMERRVITKINMCINLLSHKGKHVNIIEVGYKVLGILQDNKRFFVPIDGILDKRVGIFNSIYNVIFNDRIFEKGEFEYHFILNYGDNKKQYVYINRDIQKEREKVIEEILNN